MVLADHVIVTSPLGREIRWNFSELREVGQFVNGDWWVQGPVTVTSILPFEYVASPERWMSGSMLNPDPMGGTGGNGRDQGFDSTAYAQYDPGRWTPALCENLQLPKQYANGSSIVSTVSNPAPGVVPQLYFSAVLTVVAAIPAANSFRPPTCPGTVAVKAPQWTLADLDLTKLVNLFIWDEYMNTSRPYLQTLARVSGFVIDHVRGWLGRYMLAEETADGYGRDYTEWLGNAILGLISDLGTTQKRQLAVQIVQKGIDNFYLIESGQRWAPDGGHMSGRKFPILLAGLLLDEPDMLAIGVNYHESTFGEDGQTFYVEETSPGVYNNGNGGYVAADVGMAEWGHAHHVTPSLDNRDWTGGGNYRRCCTGNVWGAQMMAAVALGLRDAWGHEAFFDYVDRYLTQMPVDPYTGQVYPDWQRFYAAAQEDVWDDVRPLIGQAQPATLIGPVRVQNDTAFARDAMIRTVVPVREGALPDLNQHIVTSENEYVAWRPLQTESSSYATWPDGSIQYAECWVPTSIPANTIKLIELSVDNSVTPPSGTSIHPAVAAQFGSFISGGSPGGAVFRCDIDPGTARSNPRVLGTHGVLDTIVDNVNCVRLRWKVRSADGRYVWEHRFEFYRRVPYVRFWSGVSFSNDQTTDLTDYLQTGIQIVGQQCWPALEDNFKFAAHGGTFAGWNRSWAGAGPVGDGQGMGIAQGVLLFIDPANPGSASAADTNTVRAYDRLFGGLSEEIVSTQWGEHGTFGPLGNVPALPQQFSSVQNAIDASVALGRSLRDTGMPVDGHSIHRGFWDARFQSLPDPSGAGTQGDHGVTKYHFITVLGVPTGLPAIRRAASQEWFRPVYFYETGNWAGGGGTVDMEIVKPAKHPSLGYWFGRQFEADLLGKATRHLPAFGRRHTSQRAVHLTRINITATTNFTADDDRHYIYSGTGPVTIELPSAGRSWVVVENASAHQIEVDPPPGLTNSGPGIVRPGEVFFYVLADAGANDWTVTRAFTDWGGYDRQHMSINMLTHLFLLTGDPMVGVQIDHFREQLRGALRPWNYAGGNFTIKSYEADREVGRCMSAASWIEAIAPEASFRADINSRINTTLSANLAETPEGLMFGGVVPGFTKVADLLAPGHELRGLEHDSSTVTLGNNEHTPGAPAGPFVPCFTPWQAGMFTAGLYAWYKLTGNARALDLCRIYGNTAIEHIWFEDFQVSNGYGQAAGGHYSSMHGIRLGGPGITAGNMPPASMLPPNTIYSRSAGGKGPDIGDRTCAYRVWAGLQTWTWPTPMIAREIMLLDGTNSGPLWEKVNRILLGMTDTYYTPQASANTWSNPADHDMDWLTAIDDPFSQDYSEVGAGTIIVRPDGRGPNAQFGALQVFRLDPPVEPNPGGVIIVRGR